MSGAYEKFNATGSSESLSTDSEETVGSFSPHPTTPVGAVVCAPMPPPSVRRKGKGLLIYNPIKKRHPQKPRESQLMKKGIIKMKTDFINVEKGENVTTKIYKYWESVQKDIVITSATGVLSAVTLRHGIIDEISISYEGVYEILIFKGLFIKKGKCSGKYGGVKGGLSIKIWGTDGRILAGNVSGKLIAATPVQVMLGIIDSNPKNGFNLNENRKPKRVATANLNAGGSDGSSEARPRRGVMK